MFAHMYEEPDLLFPRIKMGYQLFALHVFKSRPVPLGTLFRGVGDVRSEIDDSALQHRVRNDVLQNL